MSPAKADQRSRALSDEPKKIEPKKVEPPKNASKAPPGDRNFKAGIAVGIGSAAIVAALLYSRSGPKKKK